MNGIGSSLIKVAVGIVLFCFAVQFLLSILQQYMFWIGLVALCICCFYVVRWLRMRRTGGDDLSLW